MIPSDFFGAISAVRTGATVVEAFVGATLSSASSRSNGIDDFILNKPLFIFLLQGRADIKQRNTDCKLTKKY